MLDKEDITKLLSRRSRALFKPSDFQDLRIDDRVFLKWFHRSNSIAHIVFGWQDELKIIVFSRRKISSTGIRKYMCDWCKSLHYKDGISGFTSKNLLSNDKSHSINLCSNLECNEFASGEKVPRAIQMSESLTSHERLERLSSSVSKFYRLISNSPNL